MVDMSIVSTIGEKCKKCYACIKSCPAHAIKVKDGKASVISFRCISCGHCTTVCSQNAKVVLSYFGELKNDIASCEIDALVAPSFVVSFLDVGLKLVSVLKALGFKNVYEVGFGADSKPHGRFRARGQKDQSGQAHRVYRAVHS